MRDGDGFGETEAYEETKEGTLEKLTITDNGE